MNFPAIFEISKQHLSFKKQKIINIHHYENNLYKLCSCFDFIGIFVQIWERKKTVSYHKSEETSQGNRASLGL